MVHPGVTHAQVVTFARGGGRGHGRLQWQLRQTSGRIRKKSRSPFRRPIVQAPQHGSESRHSPATSLGEMPVWKPRPSARRAASWMTKMNKWQKVVTRATNAKRAEAAGCAARATEISGNGERMESGRRADSGHTERRTRGTDTWPRAYDTDHNTAHRCDIRQYGGGG